MHTDQQRQKARRDRREREAQARLDAKAHILTHIMQTGLNSMTRASRVALRDALISLVLTQELEDHDYADDLGDFRRDLNDMLGINGTAQ